MLPKFDRNVNMKLKNLLQGLLSCKQVSHMTLSGRNSLIKESFRKSLFLQKLIFRAKKYSYNVVGVRNQFFTLKLICNYPGLICKAHRNNFHDFGWVCKRWCTNQNENFFQQHVNNYKKLFPRPSSGSKEARILIRWFAKFVTLVSNSFHLKIEHHPCFSKKDCEFCKFRLSSEFQVSLNFL